jgi:quercetin dioxygenase-like cupin family protein
MQLYDWSAVEKEQLNPLFVRQCIHSDRMTVARIWLGKGCIVPLHSHENEQVSMIEQGRLKFVLDGRELIVTAGQVLRIPPNVPHSAEALDEVIATDLFSPCREDWKAGTDAYLRVPK